MAREVPVLIVVTGGGVLALWIYVRLGEQRPHSMKGAIAHALFALAALSAVPLVMELLLGRTQSHNEGVFGLLVVLLPASTYAFLATLYVFEHLQRRLYAR